MPLEMQAWLLRFLAQLCARLGRAPDALEHALYLTDDTVCPWHLPGHLGTGVEPGPD